MEGDSTKCVHGAEIPDTFAGSVTTPIYQTSTFVFKDGEEIAKAVKGEKDSYVYTRWNNPTVERLEEKLAILEEAEDCAFFSSGMAAISTAVLSLVKRNDYVVAIRDLYGETYRLFNEILPNLGVNVIMIDTNNVNQLEDALQKEPRIVYIETPTNPTLKVVDISLFAKLAHEKGSLLLIDNTFASPVNQRPSRYGADLIIHSATKYLNGHADVIAGAVAGDKETIKRIKRFRRVLGGTLDPHAAWLILRGIKTMAIRVRTQNYNAQRLAEYLDKHPKVERVYYPGLKNHPQHYVAVKQMSGFGGMLSFEIKGSKSKAIKFTESLRVAYLAASLGGVETLVSQPSTVTHTQMNQEERKKAGISDTLIRVSVGIEDVEDIINDFEQAFLSI
jgi:cystathionine beta-lyase/cystathionine gamma-synthase